MLNMIKVPKPEVNMCKVTGLKSKIWALKAMFTMLPLLLPLNDIRLFMYANIHSPLWLMFMSSTCIICIGFLLEYVHMHIKRFTFKVKKKKRSEILIL